MKTVKYFIFIFGLIAFFGCEDKVDIKVPDGEERLVIGGMFLNVPNSEIILTKSARYFDEGPTPRVSNAEVYIIEESGDTITLFENNSNPGHYIAPEAGEIGKTYTLHIRLTDGSTYTSLPEKMARVPEIDTVYYKSWEELDNPFIDEGYIVLIDSPEPEGIGDYYRWMYRLNGELMEGPDDLLYASDELVDGNFITEVEIAYDLILGDRVDVIQMSISERAFNFIFLLDQQATQIGSPFDAPPSPIKGNVLNNSKDGLDALGYFFVSAQSVKGVDLF